VPGEFHGPVYYSLFEKRFPDKLHK